jgi:hypothetical protein
VGDKEEEGRQMTNTAAAKDKKNKRSEIAKEAQREHKKRGMEFMELSRRYEESKRKGPKQMEKEQEAQMDILHAPIREAFDKGEISAYEAIRRTCHVEIKWFQEQIQETEALIEHFLHFGMAVTRDPKILARQREWIEKRRQLPTVQLGIKNIRRCKKRIQELEHQIQGTYRLEAEEEEGESH